MRIVALIFGAFLFAATTKKTFCVENEAGNSNNPSLLANETLVVNRKGAKASADEFLRGKVIALYFSASWCKPCRNFTPKLKAFYETMKAHKKPFEVVFVSLDDNEEDQKKYYQNEMAEWAYLEYDDSARKELIATYDEVERVPTLLIIRPDGEVVVRGLDSYLTLLNDDIDTLAVWEHWFKLYSNENGGEKRSTSPKGHRKKANDGARKPLPRSSSVDLSESSLLASASSRGRSLSPGTRKENEKGKKLEKDKQPNISKLRLSDE